MSSSRFTDRDSRSLRSRLFRLCAFAALLSGIGVVRAQTQSPAQPRAGSLSWVAQQAKANGQSSSTVNLTTGSLEFDPDVASDMRLDSFAVVRLSSKDVLEAHTTDWIFTIHSFKRTQPLALRPVRDPYACRSLPSQSVPPNSAVYRLPVFGGTALIEGVRITAVEAGVTAQMFDEDSDYLFAGDICPGNLLRPKTQFLLRVSPDGHIYRIPTDKSPLALALDSYGSLGRLKTEIAKLRLTEPE